MESLTLTGSSTAWLPS